MKTEAFAKNLDSAMWTCVSVSVTVIRRLTCHFHVIGMLA